MYCWKSNRSRSRDALLENPGGDLRVPDRPEQDRIAGAKPLDLGVGEDLTAS